MDYLAIDPDVASLRAWSYQANTAIEPQDKLPAAGAWLVSSLGILTPDQFAGLMDAGVELVAAKEGLDARRCTGRGEDHAAALRALVGAARAWAAGKSGGEASVGSSMADLLAEKQALLARITDLVLELTVLRAAAGPAAHPSPEQDDDEQGPTPPEQSASTPADVVPETETAERSDVSAERGLPVVPAEPEAQSPKARGLGGKFTKRAP